MEEITITRTSALTIRLKNEVRKEIEKYAKMLHLRPSSLCALILEEKLEEWVEEYAERVYKEVHD